MHYPHFPEALAPRTRLVPVRNTYAVVFPDKQETNKMGTGKPDIFVMIYYRSEHAAEVTVRRLDIDRWTFDVHLRIDSVPGHASIANSSSSSSSGSSGSSSRHNGTRSGESETIVIANPGNASFVLHHVIHTSAVRFQPLSEAELYGAQKIPRIIMQTYYTTNATNVYHWNAFQTFVELNPEYEVLLMLDKHCRVFIRKHFPAHVLTAYDALVPKAFKADLFRYCYLYVKGGCYFDNKMINRAPLRRAILPDDEFLACSDTLSWGLPAKTLKDTARFYNAVICAAPRDERVLRAIKQVVDTINSRNYRLSDLAITGPVAFFEATRGLAGERNLRFQHEMGRHPYVAPWSPEGHSVGRQYRDYYVREKLHGEVILTKFFQGYYSTALRRYGDLWNQGKVYYEPDHLAAGRLRLYVEPGVLPYYSCTFEKHGDGLYAATIVVERRTLWSYLWPPTLYALLVEEGKLFIRHHIVKYGNGGLTDKIELKVVDDEASDETYLSLDVPSPARPKTVYRLDKHAHVPQ